MGLRDQVAYGVGLAYSEWTWLWLNLSGPWSMSPYSVALLLFIILVKMPIKCSGVNKAQSINLK